MEERDIELLDADSLRKILGGADTKPVITLPVGNDDDEKPDDATTTW